MIIGIKVWLKGDNVEQSYTCCPPNCPTAAPGQPLDATRRKQLWVLEISQDNEDCVS